MGRRTEGRVKRERFVCSSIKPVYCTAGHEVNQTHQTHQKKADPKVVSSKSIVEGHTRAHTHTNTPPPPKHTRADLTASTHTWTITR